MNEAAFQQCMNPGCGATYAIEQIKVACTSCGSLLDIKYDWAKLPKIKSLNYFEHRWGTKGGRRRKDGLIFPASGAFGNCFPFYRTER